MDRKTSDRIAKLEAKIETLESDLEFLGKSFADTVEGATEFVEKSTANTLAIVSRLEALENPLTGLIR